MCRPDLGRNERLETQELFGQRWRHRRALRNLDDGFLNIARGAAPFFDRLQATHSTRDWIVDEIQLRHEVDTRWADFIECLTDEQGLDEARTPNNEPYGPALAHLLVRADLYADDGYQDPRLRPQPAE
jgi:hypothetical protein